MRGSDTRSRLSAITLLLCACSDEAAVRAIDWRVRFACDADRSRSTLVKLEIRAGGCSEGEPSVFSTTLSPGEEVPVPRTLAAGRYGFWAEARTETSAVALGCSELRLPTASIAETVMQGLQGVCQEPSDADVLDGSPVRDASDDTQATFDAQPSDDASADTGSASDAGVDASLTCSCDGCEAPCACAAESCFVSRLFVTYSGTAGSWRPTSTSSVPNGSLLRLGFLASAPSGDRVLSSPAPLVVLAESRFSDDAELDAFAVLPDGRYLFSTRDSETFDAEPFDDDDLLAFEPLNQQKTRYLDMGALLGDGCDVDALHVADDGSIYFSVDAQVTAPAGAVYGAGDLLVYSQGITRLVNGSDAFAGRDLQAITVNPTTGHFVVSLSGTGAIGTGSAFGAGDLIELAFGPGEPFKAGYQLFMRGSDEFLGPDGELSAVHFGD